MHQDCPECLRLWNAYLESRKEYASARRELECARGAEQSAYKSAVKRHNEALETNDRLRMGLAEHEEAAHARSQARARA